MALGASHRASLALFKTAQALAIIRDREFVLPDDIKELAVSVLAHRLILTPEARARGVSASSIVTGLLNNIPVIDAD